MVTYCPADGCLKKDLIGTQVQKADSSDKKLYIYPLYSTLNKSTGVLKLVNAALTCPPQLRCQNPVSRKERRRVWFKAFVVFIQIKFMIARDNDFSRMTET